MDRIELMPGSLFVLKYKNQTVIPPFSKRLFFISSKKINNELFFYVTY